MRHSWVVEALSKSPLQSLTVFGNRSYEIKAHRVSGQRVLFNSYTAHQVAIAMFLV